MAEKIRRQSGFTLVELIMTVVLLGILAAFAAPRFAGKHGFEERGFYDETVTALRYAQKTAIASRRMVCVFFTAQTVSLKIAAANPAATTNCSNASDKDLVHPDGKTPYKIDASTDSKYRAADVKFSSFPTLLTFDPLGTPSAAATLTITDLSTSITVEAETGYVH